MVRRRGRSARPRRLVDSCAQPLYLAVRCRGATECQDPGPSEGRWPASLSVSVALALVAVLDACVSTGAVPGSDKVHVTTNPSDVSACTAVGNINVPGGASNKEIQFRNQAVGFGANTALVTVTVFGTTPVDGVAPHCPQ